MNEQAGLLTNELTSLVFMGKLENATQIRKSKVSYNDTPESGPFIQIVTT